VVKVNRFSDGSWTLENVPGVATTEVFALRHGHQLLENIGCSPMIVESDR
jgi:hypothetical protein